MADDYTPTYNFDDRLLTSVDRARSALQDVGDVTDDTGAKLWEFSNEHIAAQIGEYGYREGVAQLASQLATKYAKMPDEFDEDGGLKITYKGLVKRFETLADELRAVVEVADQPTPTFVAVGTIQSADAGVALLRFGNSVGPYDTWGRGRGNRCR